MSQCQRHVSSRPSKIRQHAVTRPAPRSCRGRCFFAIGGAHHQHGRVLRLHCSLNPLPDNTQTMHGGGGGGGGSMLSPLALHLRGSSGVLCPPLQVHDGLHLNPHFPCAWTPPPILLAAASHKLAQRFAELRSLHARGDIVHVSVEQPGRQVPADDGEPYDRLASSLPGHSPPGSLADDPSQGAHVHRRKDRRGCTWGGERRSSHAMYGTVPAS